MNRHWLNDDLDELRFVQDHSPKPLIGRLKKKPIRLPIPIAIPVPTYLVIDHPTRTSYASVPIIATPPTRRTKPQTPASLSGCRPG